MHTCDRDVEHVANLIGNLPRAQEREREREILAKFSWQPARVAAIFPPGARRLAAGVVVVFV